MDKRNNKLYIMNKKIVLREGITLINSFVVNTYKKNYTFILLEVSNYSNGGTVFVYLDDRDENEIFEIIDKQLKTNNENYLYTIGDFKDVLVNNVGLSFMFTYYADITNNCQLGSISNFQSFTNIKDLHESIIYNIIKGLYDNIQYVTTKNLILIDLNKNYSELPVFENFTTKYCEKLAKYTSSNKNEMEMFLIKRNLITF